MVIKVNMRFAMPMFDKSILKHRWHKMNKNPLERAGNIVKLKARGSIRQTSGKLRRPSQAPKPPRSHSARRPFKMIFSVPMYARTQVIIGMVKLGGMNDQGNPIPGLQEHGGWARRRVRVLKPPRRNKRGQMTRQRYEFVEKTVRYPARPFMGPALEKTKHRYPELWRNALK